MTHLRYFRRTLMGLSLMFTLSSTANALGPVDGEVILSLWNNQFESDLGDGEADVGSLTASGEIWIGDNWGLRLARFESDLEETELSNETRTQVELRRRLISASDNNFFALGVGAESIDLVNGESSEGLRLSAEARLALTPITYFYGRGAYLPWMEDAGTFTDITGSELEFGVSFTPFPFVSVKLGYLTLDLDYENAGGSGGSASSDGILIGAGLHW